MAKHKFPKMLKEYKLHKLMFDLSSEDYHGIAGTYSSSQFKDLLDDDTIFIKKYIEKTIEREEVPAFSVGTYFHTGVLEPHKLTMDCAVYPGKVRRGSEWDKFKAQAGNKTIVTPTQVDQAERLMASVRDSPIAMGYVERGVPEVSLFTEIVIAGGLIYAPKFSKLLTSNGWAECEEFYVPHKTDVKLIVKVRADSLGDDFILDLKSTTGNARSQASMRQKISHYQYDLSASLYLDMFSLVKGFQMTDFIWTFASKDFFNCQSYKASEANIRVGRAKYMRALVKLADLMANGFKTYDHLGMLEPLQHELENLKERDTDLL